ncbi:MAG: EamA/RhaT family transporter [Anaerolineae bacterium]|nr:EamA/RhaT family transporter [Anaerolineae bacterium]
MSIRGALYLSLAACIWGGMYVVSKYALDFVPPLTLLFLRFVIAAVVLGWLNWRQKSPLLPAQDRGLLFQIGAIGYFLSISAQFVGTKLSSAHMGAVITTLSPLFLSLFAVLLLKEAMSFKQKVAMALACIGVLIVMGLPDESHAGQAQWLGNLALLLAAVFWGYYSVLARKASRRHTSLQITTWGIWVATALTLPFTLLERRQWSPEVMLTWPIILSVLYLGVVSTAVAAFCWNKGLSLMSAHQVGLFFFLQPVVGSLLGWLLLGEALTLSFFFGSALIIAGVYLVLVAETPAAAEDKPAVQSSTPCLSTKARN